MNEAPACLVFHVLEQAPDCPSPMSVLANTGDYLLLTKCGKVNDMRRLVLFKELDSLFGIANNVYQNIDLSQRGAMCAYRRSPSAELAKIQRSPAFLPKREPSGSVLMTCSIALPTSPVPPVTRITSVMVVEMIACW